MLSKFRSRLLFNLIDNHHHQNVLKLFASSYGGKTLFTPGPLQTTMTVKAAMMEDVGAGTDEFKECVEFSRKKLLKIAGVADTNEYAAIILQGSGTYGIESVIQATSNDNSHLLILENGFYGRRIAAICNRLNVKYDIKQFEENRAINPNKVKQLLENNRIKYTNIGIIHSETSSGALNPIKEIGHWIKHYLPESSFFVDSMCCFGAIEVNVKEAKVDFLVSSANKCIQSVPGVSFIIANKQKLAECKLNSRSLCLDIVDQYEVDLQCKLFRFTPPTHVLLAFKQALIELDDEGGPHKRYERIALNHKIIRDEMLRLGFKEFVPLEEQSKVINSFYYPKDEKFVYERFYKLLRHKGKVIYSKSLTDVPTFRIGNIGDLHPHDMRQLLVSIKQVLNEMGVKIPVS